VFSRGGRIRMSDLPETYTQIPDLVFVIERNYFYEDSPNIKAVSILKNRNGSCLSSDLYFDEKHITFLNIEKKESKNISDEDW